ncbi:14745_t:CDS:2 [Funneliformis caledonium]|uniref:14745_t:CDS:1 n=1 Tax=Funneliformis caledonium TaxID=1117310 RepID=A0A9N8VTB2_9GLOM|nr:14745_t:CDS:2 [Funneliformis caledonium]
MSERRALHTSNYLNDKIYFLGGETDRASHTNDFFYLDVSAPFTLDSLPIVDLTRNVQIAKHKRATSSVCGPNKDTIFLFGGDIDGDESAASLVYTFNISVPQWTNTNIEGPQPQRRVASSVVCDENARMYIFGGTNGDGYQNDFDILDTDQLTWSLGSRVNIPPPMDLATANLLSNGKIVYLGGYSNRQLIDMSKIYLYDTINDEWSRMFTMGTPPRGRAWHSAILTQDGRIIVYGGVPVSPDDQLSVLDTTVLPFKWSIPEISFTPSSAPYSWIYKGSAPAVYSNQIVMLDISDKNDYNRGTSLKLDIGQENPYFILALPIVYTSFYIFGTYITLTEVMLYLFFIKEEKGKESKCTIKLM